jgi:two-component system cell cycle sensor histidine kinase/response regulator CckA
MLDASPDCVLVVGRDGVVTEINPAGLEMLEFSSFEDLNSAPLVDFVCPEQREAFEVCVEAVWRGEKGYAEFESIGRRGRHRWLEMHAAPIRDARGEVISFLGMVRDNTARRDLNKQFIQAQKMEVVGHLAGGVAHDFNNMLGIILGYTEILMNGMTPGSTQYEQAQAVFHTGERAAALTRQLLIFSRKETPRPQVVDMSELIVKIDPMLRRLIRENIKLVTLPEPELRKVETDPSQIEQVLMNLTVNARDAMPNGGVITVETSNTTVWKGDPAHPGMAPGCYSALSVTDTGGGMSDEVKSKIFEAFFTTKPAGQGTGLGLATCQSIVRHWSGYFEVESRLGAGSTFRVYLPCLPASAKAAKSSEPSDLPPRGVETVLVVEDEPGLLALTVIVLKRQGYTVLKAANGKEALGIVQEGSEHIDLVLTDMVMPEMGGRIMADWLGTIRPGIKVLFTSGYTDCSMGGVIDPAMEFLPKPYTPAALLRKVREVIDRATPGKPAQPAGILAP